MGAHPIAEVVLAKLPCCEAHDRIRRVVFPGVEVVTVQLQRDDEGDERRAFIAIYEAMGTANARCRRRRDVDHVERVVIRRQMIRAAKSRFEGASIAYARRATEQLKAFAVGGDERFDTDNSHFASAWKVRE